MPQPWRTVRVFISSTFRDMHAERDHLVRIVFPELKERCRQRHVQLIDVDLRWGVAQEQAEGGGALDICLDEIDSCRPYFLGLVGHRYGSVPPGDKHSITAQEIYHGVLHNNLPRQLIDLRPFVEGILEGRTLLKEQVSCLTRCYQWNAAKRKYLLRDDITPEDTDILRMIFDAYSIYQKDRSFFFFRSESLTAKLAGSNIAEFFETDKDNSDKLAALKKDIAKAGLPHFEYDDVEAFGKTVLDTLWARIDAEFPEKREEKERDWLKEEAELHELFMADRTRRFVGRSDILKGMHSSVEKDDDHRLLVVTGEPGCGKSALMARFTEEVIHRHPDWLVLAHFVGASPSSTSLRLTLRNLCTHINRSLGVTDDVTEDYRELVNLFPQLLQKISGTRRVLLVIDALNQFDKTDNAHSMNWLPQSLPPNVKVVVSTLAGEVIDALLARRPKPDIVKVNGLKQDEIKQLVTDYLGEIHHEFPTSAIRDAFYEKIKSGHPLYIIVALEELKIFPKYEELEERIKTLPGSVPELFSQVLKRVEGDLGQPVVKDFMCYLACGRHGMTAEELQTLLKGRAPVIDPANPPERYPDMLFARLRRAFSAYLFERSGVIDFFHGQLKEAVGQRYLPEEVQRDRVHHTIADYFETRWKEPHMRAVDELPHQLTKSKDWDGVKRVLCDLRFVETKCAAGMTYQLVADYHGLELHQPGPPIRTAWMHMAKYGVQCPFCLAWSQITSLDLGKEIACPACGSLLKLNVFALKSQWQICPPRRDIQGTRRNATQIIPPEVGEFADFVREQAPTLHRTPQLTLQQAHNWPNGSAPNVAALASLASMSDRRTWFRWINKPEQRLTSLMTLTTGTGVELVMSGCYSPDGSRILTASQTLRIWDAASGEEITALVGHTGGVSACVFSPDGTLIASGSGDNTVKLWDSLTGKEVMNLAGHTSGVNACAFSPTGTHILSASEDKTLRVWEVSKGIAIGTLAGHAGRVNDCAFSPDGRLILSASEDGTLHLWDANTLKKCGVLNGHSGRVNKCAFSPDGSRILSVGAEIVLWDLASLAQIWKLNAGSEVLSCAFSPDGARFVTGIYNRSLTVWDLQGRKPIADLAGRQWGGRACTYSPDGKRILSAFGFLEGLVRIWDADNASRTFGLPGHNGTVRSCSVAPDCTRVASLGGPMSTHGRLSLKLWDLSIGKEMCPHAFLKGKDEFCTSLGTCCFAPDGRYVVTADGDLLQLWDATVLQQLRLDGNTANAWLCCFTPDGGAVIANHGTSISLWDLEARVEAGRLKGHRGHINHFAISVDGSWVVSVADDNTLKCWDMRQRKELCTLSRQLEMVECVAFSPDGTTLASASKNGTLQVWNAKRCTLVATLVANDVKSEQLGTSCVFFPDGRRIVSSSWNGSLSVWECHTWQQVAALTRQRNNGDPRVAPSGAYLLAGTDANLVRLWDLSSTTVLCEWPVNWQVWAMDWAPSGRYVSVGDRAGSLFLLEIMGHQIPPPVLTVAYLYRLVPSRYDVQATAPCAWCSQRFPVGEKTLDLIRDINRNANLSPDQSPCLELPAEAWDEPGLLSECPLCHRPLKFNPFIVDNRESY